MDYRLEGLTVMVVYDSGEAFDLNPGEPCCDKSDLRELIVELWRQGTFHARCCDVDVDDPDGGPAGTCAVATAALAVRNRLLTET